jgi:hypothetical protein
VCFDVLFDAVTPTVARGATRDDVCFAVRVVRVTRATAIVVVVVAYIHSARR